MDELTIEREILQLQKQGYAASNLNGTILVKDPVHSSGYGVNAGRLILSGHKDCILSSQKEVWKFIDARS